VRSGSAASCTPITSASAGKMGSMYEGSLELDTLKKTTMNADQTSAKRCQLKPLLSTTGPDHIRGAVQARTVSHGRMPAARIGTKYHHAPSR